MSEDPIYILQFEWPEGAAGATTPSCALEAETEEQARLQAALLYAGTYCDEPSPTAYRIVGPGGDTVYRYPESSPSSDEPRIWPIDIPLPGRA